MFWWIVANIGVLWWVMVGFGGLWHVLVCCGVFSCVLVCFGVLASDCQLKNKHMQWRKEKKTTLIYLYSIFII